ncbi:MAG: SAM-dependent chlorinase/fluorinase [Elainellaceae cyanobacterium]
MTIQGCGDLSIYLSILAPCLTLLTDFGLRDSYVGVMKGVVRAIAPTLPVVDLTHAVAPQDVAAARFHLMSAYLYFPPGTIHVVVVDPGVGSTRRAIALALPEADPPGIIVAPDNGVISGVLSQQSEAAIASMRAVELTCRDYWRVATPSFTFHGRDIFAPVAAHLASGVPLAQVGRDVSVDSLVRLPIPPAKVQSRHMAGTIQHIDHFGNGITTLSATELLELRMRLENGAAETIAEPKGWLEHGASNPSLQVRLHTAKRSYDLPAHTTYNQVSPGDGLALMGSHGWLEIAVNQGSAAQMFDMNVGDPVEMRLRSKEDSL